MSSSYKLFSDPIHGFISVPCKLLLPLVKSPEVQRLRRIRQLGVGNLVFPSAEHSRFGHALGSLALMQDALRTLKESGTPISDDEFEASLAAALLHDIGHGPFSHTLEFQLFRAVPHEYLTRRLMQRMNERFDGALNLTLEIFDGTYQRPFFGNLLASQLDVDRLDYLRRDSHFTGVIEGSIGVERVIRTMRVYPREGGAGSRIVIEAKGIYSAENVLVARRHMYWQVYVHKTVLAGDHVLVAALCRARSHLKNGNNEAIRNISPTLTLFLEKSYDKSALDDSNVLDAFLELDDTDVMASLKCWMHSPDPILADLSRRFIERDLFRCVFLPESPSPDTIRVWKQRVADTLVQMGLSNREWSIADADYYLFVDRSSHSAYHRKEGPIHTLEADGTVSEVLARRDSEALDALTHYVEKPYVCFPKAADLGV